MEFTIVMIIAFATTILVSSLIFVAMKIGYNVGVKNGNVEKQVLIDENIALKKTLQEQSQRLDFLEDSIDLPINTTSQFKNKNGDEIVIMRKERYADYEAQEEILNIIEEKCINMELIHDSEDVVDYNKGLPGFLKPWNELTFNEFDKVKRKK